MFQSAYNKHRSWGCEIGGFKADNRHTFYGRGCVLDKNHVLTAHHVWSKIKADYEYPGVKRAEGTFRCEVVFESERDDILLLRQMEIIRKSNEGTFSEFPRLNQEAVSCPTRPVICPMNPARNQEYP